MATDFLMPKLGLTMEEGTITAWLVPDGAEVTAGMPVMAIETDKVETEVEASANGYLHQRGAVGDTFPCGAVVGQIDVDGSGVAPAASAPAATSPSPVAASPVADATSTARPAPPTATAGGRRFISPNARRVAADLGVDLARVTGTGPGGRVVAADVEAAGRDGGGSAGGPVTESAAPEVPWGPAGPESTGPADAAHLVAGAVAPARTGPAVGSTPSRPATAAARQLADLLGIDLAAVAADPHDGYVTRESVARHVRGLLQSGPAPAGGVTNPAGALPDVGALPLGQTPTEVQRFSGMRATIAKRMHASLQQMAQLTLTMDAEMDAVVADRKARADAGNAPGYTDYVLAAAARALRDHPGVNAQVTANGIATLPDIHVGLAVALPAGLVVPVVHHADRLDLAALSAETTRLADAARNGKLALADLEGGTFSVSALGMFGVDAFTPVINPPNVAILGVGRLRDEIAVVDGRIASRRRMTLSLTWDHRVLDGAPAAAFAQRIVALLADPAALDR